MLLSSIEEQQYTYTHMLRITEVTSFNKFRGCLACHGSWSVKIKNNIIDFLDE